MAKIKKSNFTIFLSIFDFFKNYFFQEQFLQALEKQIYFFFEFEVKEYLSFHTHFQVLKNIKNLQI